MNFSTLANVSIWSLPFSFSRVKELHIWQGHNQTTIHKISTTGSRIRIFLDGPLRSYVHWIYSILSRRTLMTQLASYEFGWCTEMDRDNWVQYLWCNQSLAWGHIRTYQSRRICIRPQPRKLLRWGRATGICARQSHSWCHTFSGSYSPNSLVRISGHSMLRMLLSLFLPGSWRKHACELFQRVGVNLQQLPTNRPICPIANFRKSKFQPNSILSLINSSLRRCNLNRAWRLHGFRQSTGNTRLQQNSGHEVFQFR